jgi:hypothetical protein
MGSVRLKRAYYRCAACRQACHPYDGRIDLRRHGLSSALSESAALLAACQSYGQAATLMRQLTGQSLDQRTFHRLVQSIGGQAAQEEQAAAQASERAELPAADLRTEKLHTACDGVLVRFRGEGFKEVKVGMCYGRDEAQRPFCRHVARTEPAERFKWHVAALTARCGLDQARQSALVSDAAAWIWDHVAGVLREDTVHIVDWYHASQHVWECGQALHGEATPQARAWVESILDLLHDGRVRDILKRLRNERAATRAPSKRQALAKLITYVTNQDDRLAYDRFRKQGFDIGSGRVEAACKQVVAQRLKGVGMAWSPAGAQAVLSLRAHWLSKTWDPFWQRRRAG